MMAQSPPSSTSSSSLVGDSLSSTFYRCQVAFQDSSAPPRTPESANHLIQALQQLQLQINEAALFSSNEDKDDITTRSMKYLAVPYYLGQVENTFPSSMNERLDHIIRSMKYFTQFIKYMEDYKLGDKKEIEEFKAHAKVFQTKLTASSSSSSSSSSSVMPRPSRPLDPNAARTAKIARFKREKELTTQLSSMQQQRRQRISAGGSGQQLATSAGGGNGQTIGAQQQIDEELMDEHSDEAQIREFYSLLFHSYVFSTVDVVKSSVDELDILIHHRDVELRKPKDQQLSNMTPDERQKQLQQQAASAGGVGSNGGKPTMFKMTPESLFQPIPENMRHLLHNIAQPSASSSGKPGSSSSSSSSSVIPSTVNNRIDSLVNARVHAREEVFKLTNQPTMSIEEWAEAEIAAGHMPGPNANPPPKPVDPRRIVSAAHREIAEEIAEELARTNMEDGDGGLGHEDGAVGEAQAEIKRKKDSDWANWCDDHQKGVGNTMK